MVDGDGGERAETAEQRSPFFNRVLNQMRAVHDAKNRDYADDGNPFSNFMGAADVAGVSLDKVFMVMIGIKLERLRQLTSGKDPLFESLEDSILDLANYAALWLAARRALEAGRLVGFLESLEGGDGA